MYFHVVVTKHGQSIDPNDRESHAPQYVFSKTKRKNEIIIKYHLDLLL